MPTIDIPNIKINKVEIHEIPVWKTDIQILNNISKPIVDIPGCVRVHRNNLTSLIDSDKDEYGTFTVQPQRICIYAVRNPHKSGTRICPAYGRATKIRTKEKER